MNGAQKGYHLFCLKEAGKIYRENNLEPSGKGNLALPKSKKSPGHPRQRGLHVQKHSGRREHATLRQLQSPSAHAERQRMPWAKVLSLQGFGGPVGELGLHPKEEKRLLRMYRHCMARLAFQGQNSGSSFHSSRCFQFPDEETENSSRAITCLAVKWLDGVHPWLQSRAPLTTPCYCLESCHCIT